MGPTANHFPTTPQKNAPIIDFISIHCTHNYNKDEAWCATSETWQNVTHPLHSIINTQHMLWEDTTIDAHCSGYATSDAWQNTIRICRGEINLRHKMQYKHARGVQQMRSTWIIWMRVMLSQVFHDLIICRRSRWRYRRSKWCGRQKHWLKKLWERRISPTDLASKVMHSPSPSCFFHTIHQLRFILEWNNYCTEREIFCMMLSLLLQDTTGCQVIAFHLSSITHIDWWMS